MTSAVAKLGKAANRMQVAKTHTPRAKSYIHTEKKSVKFKRLAKKLGFYALVFSIFAATLSLIGFVYFYNQYAAIVERRVESGFWHTRAGIYAAPFVFRKNQKISREKAVELLRRAGYVEGEATDEVWNGSFTVGENAIEIRTSEIFVPQNAAVDIKFAGGKISAITNGKKSLEEFYLEPEMLSGRTETKRGKNNALRYADIPENLRRAILTAEDQRFFEHRGIDPRGIARAVWENLSRRAIRQGGSTITQQLVKNTFLSPEKSFSRKFSEAFLALALERRMSKEDIFALYCNEIYLGQYGSSGVHGVEQAARAYFDKDLKDLNLAEAAAIAAMIKNPNRFAPHKNASEAVARRVWIVSKMAELGLVENAEAETARRAELALAKPKLNDKTIAPYFVDAATRELTTKFQDDHLNTNFNRRVYTTIDTELQTLAETAVAGQLARLDKIYAKKGVKLQATIVALNPANGHILAMVGGRDYRESQFNRATDALRQPGSTFKPIVYAAALERGMTPMTISADRATEFESYGGKPYKPANYGDAYANKNITLKTALAKSSNVVAVKTAFDTGLRTVAQRAREFGFERAEPYPSLALGATEATPLQLAAAYAAFANGGRRIEPTLIDKIVSGEEETVYLATPQEKQIVSEKTAYMITDMLAATIERGTARSAKGALGKGNAFVGKTGSSKDGWFVGYTPNLVTVAWIGTDDSQDIKMTGGETALPLWIEFMKAVVQTRPEFGGESFPMPAGLTEMTIDPETGMLADSFCPQSETVVVPTAAASNIRCLRHQPVMETYLASNSSDSEFQPTTIVIEPTSEGVVQTEIKTTADDKEIEAVPAVREPAGIKPELKKREKPLRETYFDDYEKQHDGESEK